MDNFDNFQYDSASSYGGGIGVVDDNSSVYTAITQDNASVDMSTLSLSDSRGNGLNSARLDEDFLEDIKDEQVDLPPHACR